MMAKRFHLRVSILKVIMVIAAQICEYIKAIELYTLNKWSDVFYPLNMLFKRLRCVQLFH